MAEGENTQYTYDPFGNLRTTTDAEHNTVTIDYDIRGHKVAMHDPDMGNWTYQHDALGQLKGQTDAKGQTVTFLYDKLGRMKQRTEPEGITTWTYDQHWIGKVSDIVAPGFELHQTYDDFGREQLTNRVIDGETFSVTRAYDTQSRLIGLTYPSGLGVIRGYTGTGFLSEVRNANTDELYWRADAQDAFGNVSAATYGNDVVALRTHDLATGALRNATAGVIGTAIQNHQFEWDAVGNLEKRIDSNLGVNETFEYDNLYRLKESQRNGATNLSLAYTETGNILSKSDVGTYTYGDGDAGPHAVTSVTGTRAATYIYDANGNMLSGAGRAIEWTSFNKPDRISIAGGAFSEFAYGPDRARYKQLAQTGTGTATTIYVGKLYEERTLGVSNVEDVHYIQANGQAVAVATTSLTTGDRMRYLHRDHLGSVVAISDESGTLHERLSFDAFGKRRNPDWTADPGDSLLGQPYATTRGYTGHEHLDAVKLIHMNGRVYDPILGRMLSPDPFVQVPDSTQGLNRYTYVHNNPLSLVDPTGYFLDDLFDAIGDLFEEIFDFLEDNWRSVAAVAVHAIPVPGAGPVLSAALKGFAGGMIVGRGDLEAGLLNAATASSFYYAGDAPWSSIGKAVGKVAVHGGFSGGSSDGDTQDDFPGDATLQLAGPNGATNYFSGDATPGSVVARVGLGGTSAQLGGGKFANGASSDSFANAIGRLANGAMQSAGDMQRRLRRNLGNYGDTLLFIRIVDCPEITTGNGAGYCFLHSPKPPPAATPATNRSTG